MPKLNRYLVVFCVAIVLLACSQQPQPSLVNNDKLSTLVGVREGGIIKAKGQPGFLVYGPYAKMDAGVYRLVAKGELTGSSKPLGFIDVAAEKGKIILATKLLVAGQNKAGEIASLDFEVTKPLTDVEFRINISAQTTGSFAGYELTKVDKLDKTP